RQPRESPPPDPRLDSLAKDLADLSTQLVQREEAILPLLAADLPGRLAGLETRLAGLSEAPGNRATAALQESLDSLRALQEETRRRLQPLEQGLAELQKDPRLDAILREAGDLEERLGRLEQREGPAPRPGGEAAVPPPPPSPPGPGGLEEELRKALESAKLGRLQGLLTEEEYEATRQAIEEQMRSLREAP
ncbi:MAG: hypothetical protein HY558_07520, partial [Euryarchaeota archaeon]|nr:hypothetical protein [Euryarchaeota archaeon]